mgnify:FL=1
MAAEDSDKVIETIRKISEILERSERRRMLILLVMMIVMGLLEATGVASVMPFFAVMSNKSAVQENEYLRYVYETFEFSDVDSFLFYLGVGVFVLVVGSLSFRAFTLWVTARYVQMRGYSLSSRLLKAYLARPYSYFLTHHSADLGKTVLLEAQQVISGVLMPMAQLVANTILAAFLFAVILGSGPEFALSAIGVLGGAYILIYSIVRKFLGRIGQDRVRSNRERFQIAQEALGGIKDIKVLGLEGGYLRSFLKPARRFARSHADSQIIGQLPQYILQALAIGGMIAFVLVELAAPDREIADLLPLMALYAFAGLRLLPALQQIYLALTRIRYGRAGLDAVHGDLVGQARTPVPGLTLPFAEEPCPLRLHKTLTIDGVSYTYPQAEGASVSKLTVKIPARKTVAFVGPTGAGKTTVVDLILGLLEPQEGRLLVDGNEIDSGNVRAWQRNIGYVPQHIFLSDDTIAANIAFGVPPESIDLEAVERAARVAELHDFVVDETPEGYDTIVGERGVRLSGGQRQRIGIARALYRDPDVLVLDEATSALDNLTERAVMDAMHNMGGRKTIILIAHRLSTVRQCDTVFLLDRGEIVASGSYEELLASNDEFRRMANA